MGGLRREFNEGWGPSVVTEGVEDVSSYDHVDVGGYE